MINRRYIPPFIRDRFCTVSTVNRRRHGRLIVFALLMSACLCAVPGSRAAESGRETISRDETCERIAGKLASVNRNDCLADGIVCSGSYSVRGIPILVKEYPPLERRSPRARVLVIGGTHGDEYASVSVVFHWMRILDIHHSGLFHWIFVPLLNPDGLLREQSTRTNERGVDLNRNMPSPLWREIGYTRWVEAVEGDPRYYPGPYPMSEPEARFLVDLIHRFKPHAVISLHAPLNLVDHDGPGRPASALGSLALRKLGNFPGTLGNYAGMKCGIPVVTVELASSGRMPTDKEISAMWRDLVRWLIDTVPIEPGTDETWVEEDSEELQQEFFGK
jgi:murein peptide amidase A